jgi:hypothetical protein
MSYATWDIETTTHSSFKRKANPFDTRNWPVTHGFKKKGDTGVTEVRFGKWPPGKGWLKPVLEGVKLLVGFNIKFDLSHALQDPENLEAWMDFVVKGGNVWDCQLAEYLLCGLGQRDQMLSLDEVAPRYGGNVKVDEVKALWNAGVQTEDIDPELLSRYLCGGEDEHGVWQLGDVENTEKIALAQIDRSRKAGQLQSILLNMGALLFTVEAERNGMFVDKGKGLDMARVLDAKVDELTEALASYLPADLPFDFNWNSRFHKSALIFGGTVQWDAYEYDLAGGGTIYKHHWTNERLKYAQKDQVCVTLEQDALPLGYAAGDTVPIEVAQEHGLIVSRYAGGKSKGEVKLKKVKVDDTTKPKGRGVKAPYTFKRLTEPERAWLGSEPGVWSTGSDVIEELGKRDIPFLKLFAQLQAMAKDLGTYYITTDKDGDQKGMLTLVDALGIIHHKLNMCSTVTARLSSSDPNLQNIPKGNKSDVKLLFVSRFGKFVTDDFGDSIWVPHGKIIQSDFSSLEVYVQAILTQCKQLIADLKAGLDLHVVRLAAKEGMSYEDVFVLAKGDKSKGIAPIKEWDYKRTSAKVYSFQRAFGAGVPKIAKETGMSEDEVQRLADAEDLRYPEIPAYYAGITEQIKRNRKPSGVVVPHPDAPGVMCQLGRSTFRTPDGKLYSYQESPSPLYLVKRGVLASFSPTEIKNYVVQGTGGEWAKAAMWLAVRAFYSVRNFGGLALLVNQVHDAVYTDAHQSVAREAAACLHACMEGASDLMEYLFKWKIPVPVPSDTSWGASMMDEDSIDGLKELAKPWRDRLRREYMGGYVPSFATQGN